MFVPVALQTKPRYWQRGGRGLHLHGIWRNTGRSRREGELTSDEVWERGPQSGSLKAAQEVIAMAQL